MKRIKLLAALILILTCLPINAYAYYKDADPTYFDAPVLSEEEFKKLDDAMIIKIGSPKAISSNTELYIDSNNLNIKPFILNKKTYVPVGFIASELGAELHWNSKEAVATLKFPDKIVTIEPNYEYITIDGKSIYTADVPINIEGRVFVPIRVISENLGYNVEYYAGMIFISKTTDVSNIHPDLIDYLSNKFKDDALYGIDSEYTTENFQYIPQKTRNGVTNLKDLIKKKNKTDSELDYLINYFISQEMDHLRIDFRIIDWKIANMDKYIGYMRTEYNIVMQNSGAVTTSNKEKTEINSVMSISGELYNMARNDEDAMVYLISTIVHETFHCYTHVASKNLLLSMLYSIEDYVIRNEEAYYDKNYKNTVLEMSANIQEKYRLEEILNDIGYTDYSLSKIEIIKDADNCLSQIYSATNADPRSGYSTSMPMYRLQNDLVSTYLQELKNSSLEEIFIYYKSLSVLYKIVNGKAEANNYKQILESLEPNIINSKSQHEIMQIIYFLYNLPYYYGIDSPQLAQLQNIAVQNASMNIAASRKSVGDIFILTYPTMEEFQDICIKVIGRNMEIPLDIY